MDKQDKKWRDEDYESCLKSAKENFEGRFPKDFNADTLGSHELLDRTFILCENWESYVLNHPTCCIDRKLFDEAWRINREIWNFYQMVARYDIPPEELKPKKKRGKS